MPFIVEIKARCDDQERIRRLLQGREARFIGEDHQIDTYFRVPHGRLKLREGTIEHHLIHYHRPDQHGPKGSDVLLYKPRPDAGLKALLTRALGVLVVVDKRREIYFIDNIKFHIDRVEGVGTFVEIEAIDEEGRIGTEPLHDQCQHYLDLFDLPPASLVAGSYSDLLLEKSEGQ
ncbi:MAG TPA: class IV adenylate cyclase [Rhodothermales bacterium]|nr:class IV adenylate cyclase [Rhodothermales bacterium]